MLLYLAGQVLQPDFSHVGDAAQTVPLGALPLVDGLSVDGVSQLLFAVGSLVLNKHKSERSISKASMNRTQLFLWLCVTRAYW